MRVISLQGAMVLQAYCWRKGVPHDVGPAVGYQELELHVMASGGCSKRLQVDGWWYCDKWMCYVVQHHCDFSLFPSVFQSFPACFCRNNPWKQILSMRISLPLSLTFIPHLCCTILPKAPFIHVISLKGAPGRLFFHFSEVYGGKEESQDTSWHSTGICPLRPDGDSQTAYIPTDLFSLLILILCLLLGFNLCGRGG